MQVKFTDDRLPGAFLEIGVALFGEHIAWHEAAGVGLTVLGLDLVVRRRHAADASRNA